jgi:hypothetical protein
MKNIFLFFFTIVMGSLLISGCNHPAQPAMTNTSTLKPTALTQPTATFLPTFTPGPYQPIPFPTVTLTPLPKDIFDNFQGLSGDCKVKTAYAGVPYHEEVQDLSLTDVSIDFDRQQYFPGDPIRLSAGIEGFVIKAEHLHGIVVKADVEDPALKRHSFYLYDDGRYGDEKANDQVYTHVFAYTLDPGIYKFHLQLSASTNKAGETITRECFIAKTVYPLRLPTATPAPGDQSKSCRKIVAADPIVVRAENEGGNDSNPLSRYALNPKAVSTGAGILVTWQESFDGESPVPNAYMRLLDANANPVGTVNLLFERNWIGDTSNLVRQGDNAVLTYCGRYYIGSDYVGDKITSTDGEFVGDKITSAFLDAYGHLISEQVRSPTNQFCSYGGGEALWTGSRMLFSWTDDNNYNYKYGTHLDIADANGNSISWRVIQTDTISNSPLAIGHGRVLIAVITKTGSLIVHRLDLEGNELGEPVIIDPIPYEVDGKILTGYFKSSHVIPTTDGWMVVAASSGPGIIVVHLAPDGSLISSSAIVGTDYDLRNNGIEDAIPFEGGVAILGETLHTDVVLFISPDGYIDQQWVPQEGEQPLDGSLFENRGHLYVLYITEAKSEDPNTNQVLMRELRCVP